MLRIFTEYAVNISLYILQEIFSEWSMHFNLQITEAIGEQFIIDHFKVDSYFKGDPFPSHHLSEDYWDWSRVLWLGLYINRISTHSSQGNILNC